MNDCILVTLEDEKRKTVIQYVRLLISIRTYDVKYLRNYEEHKDIFTFPEVDNESLIYFSEIIGVFKNVAAIEDGKLHCF